MHLAAILIAATVGGTTAPSESSLDLPPDWSVDVDTYCALGVLSTRGATDSLPLVGATLRAQVWYATLGAYAEEAALPDQHLTDHGALFGARLPFANFIDLDLGFGLGFRTYANRSHASYLGDYRVTMLAGSLRAGISDRTGSVLGLRLGALLISSFEFAPQSRSWDVPPNGRNVHGSRGTRYFGGLSIGLAMTVGLDLAP